MTWEFIRTDTMPKDGVKNLPRTVMAFVWYFARQAKWQLSVIAFCFAMSSLMFAFLPYGVKVVVDSVAAGGSPEMVAIAATIFVIIYGLRAVLETIGNFLAARSYSPYTNMIRRQLAKTVMQYSYRYFQDDFAGRIASKVIETPTAMRRLTFAVIEQLIYFISLLIGLGITLLTVDPKYIWFFAGYIFIFAIILFTFIPHIQTRTRAAAKVANITRGRYTDVIVNILQVKLFARRTYEDQILKENVESQVMHWIKRDHIDWIMISLIYLSLSGLFIFTMTALYHDIAHDRIQVGDVSLILGCLIFISNNGVWISRMFSELFQTYGEIYEGIDLITAAHEVIDAPAAPAIHITRGDITLDQVHFAYPGRLVFPDLSIHIPPGQKVGLVGPSGAGKSTLVQLLLRLYDIQSGAIKIDGQNIADVQQDTLRAGIAVIPQNSDLLHRSIRDNIAYGRLDASQDDIINAARMSHAHDFILQLTDKDGRIGYDAHVGERGVKLSGGQRQRIAIARAILKDAPILLLDEATSALDSESEALIQSSLFDVMKGRTVIAIAHRLSTIQHMDRLLVMKDGQIIEDGLHTELLAQGGYYASLWARQAGGFLNL